MMTHVHFLLLLDFQFLGGGGACDRDPVAEGNVLTSTAFTVTMFGRCTCCAAAAGRVDGVTL